jgi:hypothetical protein
MIDKLPSPGMIVCVNWLAAHISDKSMTFTEIDDLEPKQFSTYGMVLQHNRDSVLIAQTCGANQVAGIACIPWSAITNVVDITKRKENHNEMGRPDGETTSGN